MAKICCEVMRRQLELVCNEHADPFDCPDRLIFYTEVFDEYGIIIHDGGSSVSNILFCPWCGTKLPESKRNRWFAELEQQGFNHPYEQDIPEAYKSSAWYSTEFSLFSDS